MKNKEAFLLFRVQRGVTPPTLLPYKGGTGGLLTTTKMHIYL